MHASCVTDYQVAASNRGQEPDALLMPRPAMLSTGEADGHLVMWCGGAWAHVPVAAPAVTQAACLPSPLQATTYMIYISDASYAFTIARDPAHALQDKF